MSRALDLQKASRVNPETRQHIVQVAERLGYVVDMMARGLKRGRSQTAAVIVHDLTNPNVAPLLRGITAGLESRGMLPLVLETRDDSERLKLLINRLLSRRIDAMLLIAARPRDVGTLRKVRRHGIPTMLAVQGVRGVRLPLCAYDEILGGRLAAQHLLSLGHRLVIQLRGPMDITSIRERADGFSKTIAGAKAREILVEGPTPEGSVEEGRALMHKLLRRRGPIPTGIFAHHDLMAIGALAAARENGLKCPEDISIVGYHDLPFVEATAPSLTSIRLPREDLGRMAAEMLLEVLDGAAAQPQVRRLAPALVLRQSTGPAKSSGDRRSQRR